MNSFQETKGDLLEVRASASPWPLEVIEKQTRKIHVDKHITKLPTRELDH